MIGKRDMQAKHSYTDLMLYSLKGQDRMVRFQKQDTELRPQNHILLFSLVQISLQFRLYHWFGFSTIQKQ